jgi:hypothetical protein
MTMPLPKMTKAHRMFLYGVLATGAMAVVIAGLTLTVFFYTGSWRRSTGPIADAQARNAVLPDTVHVPQPSEQAPAVSNTVESQVIVSGLIKSVGDGSVVILMRDGSDFTVYINSETKLVLLDARARNPIEQHPVTATTIPSDQMGHATIKKGTDNVATELVIVKDHD